MSAWPTYVRDDHFLSTNRQPVNQPLNATPSQKSGGSREHYYHFLLGYHWFMNKKKGNCLTFECWSVVR
jgi:hypothetical protein